MDKLASVKVKDIEDKLSDAKGYRERELRTAADEMKRLKKKSEESKKNWKKREQVRIKIHYLFFVSVPTLTTYKNFLIHLVESTFQF